MSVILLLFGIGVLLLALEVVVPGMILGLIGGVCMLLGVILSFERYGLSGGALASAAGLGVGAIALYLEFVFLPRSRLARMFSMAATVTGKSQPAVADRSVVGKRAVALTALAPSGMIECEGRRYEAFARSGLVPAGSEVDVIDLDNFRLIVVQTSNHHTTS